jgi:nucleoside-diphosphate-sugar epimerase
VIPKIAILGANGFIGSRTAEMLHLSQLVEIRPIVRNFASLARLARFDLEDDLDCRVADGFDESKLSEAMIGCDALIYAIAGDRQTILQTLKPVYRAAEEIGLRRIVYLSSASVHGQAPPPDTNDESPLSDRQSFHYNNSKVRAEWKLQGLRDKGTVEVVILRPGIVTGPRSQWVRNFADALLNGQAYLINQGRGICNSIYIDNLVHAIFLAATVPQIDRQAFLVGDTETVTWADVYRPIADALGDDLAQVPEAIVPQFKPGLGQRFDAIRSSGMVQGLLGYFPMKWRRLASAAIVRLREGEAGSPWRMPNAIAPMANKEMTELYQCRYKMPHQKATRLLGYEPPISFEEGCRRTIGWMGFAGYPVEDGLK